MKKKSDEAHKNNTVVPNPVDLSNNMEESLSQKEDNIQTILENIEDGYYELDLAGNFVFLNDSLCRMHGRSKEELLGVNFRQYIDEKNLRKVFEAYNKVYKTGEPNKEFGWHITRKDGSKGYIEVSITLMKDSSGKPTGFRGIVRDVQERILMEEKLLLISKAVESSSDAIGLSDPQGHHFYHNKAFIELFEYTPDELESLGGGPALYADKDIARDVFTAITKGKSWRGEFEMISKSGRKFPINLRADAIKNEKGEIVGLIGVHTDITERKKTEELLRQKEEKYRLLAEHMKDTVWITDLNLKVTYVSPSVEKILGYTQDEIIRLPLDKILTSASFKVAMDFFSIELTKALAAPPDYVLTHALELELRCKDGQTVWGECMFSLIRDDNGDPLSILGEARVITERKQIEDELRASESNFRHSLDESPLGVRISNEEGETIYANRTTLDIYGYDSIEELKKISVKDRYTPQTYAEYEARKKKRLKGEFGPSEYEISIVRKDGAIRHLHVLRKEIFWNGKKQSQIIYQDITGRKMAEEKIYQSEVKYRNILENIEDGYYEVDLAGNFTFFNDSVCKILGYSREELMGMNNKQYTDKEHSKKLFEAFNRVYKTGESAKEFDWQIIRKDRTDRYIEASVSLLKDSSDKPLGFRGIIRDVTDRKKAEEKLQQTLNSLKRAVGATIQVLVSALESKDPYTAGHQSRSADLACAIATKMGLDEDKIEGIRMAGIVHDIGKLAVPAEILTKPTKLTNLEFSLIKEHSHCGYEMLKDVESPWPLAEIVHQHHERMNGSGYPRNLKGDEILLESRILAVADVVEAMASHRPYRASLGIEPALEEIEKNKGILYDDSVADACLKLFREKGYQLT
jgi:PAS domain S-box-containing protein